MTEKEKHLDIREKLRNLPSVQASDDFVMKLQRRINMADAQPSSQIHKQHQEKLEGGFFARLFGPSKNAWMVPAMGVTAVVFLVFIWVFVINQNNVTTSNEDAQTMTSKDTDPSTGGDNNSSPLEQKTTLGETLKTELPGKEIVESFGYVGEDRRDLSRGDMEGGTVDEITTEKTGKSLPEVKKVEAPKLGLTEEETDDKTIDGTLKTEDKVRSATMPGKTDKTTLKKKESNNERKPESTEKDTNTFGAEQEAKNRVARNIIDQTDLENLQEKVDESMK